MLAIDATTLMVAAIPGVLALVGVAMNQANSRREQRQKQHLEEVASAANQKADNTKDVLDAWREQNIALRQQLDRTERSSQAQLSHLGEQLNLVQASNEKCHEERAGLLRRVAELERPPGG